MGWWKSFRCLVNEALTNPFEAVLGVLVYLTYVVCLGAETVSKLFRIDKDREQ